jgi:hypothetical protein
MKKPAAVFEVLFQGKGIYPEQIPFGLLSSALTAVQHLSVGGKVTEDDEEEVKETEPGPVRLVRIVRGSAGFECWTQYADASREALQEAGKIVEKPQRMGDRDFVLRPLEELSRAANKLGCIIIIKEPGKDGIPWATIDANSYGNISRAVFISGDTSITGTVQRAGGVLASMGSRCALRVPFQTRLLYCRVNSPDTARKLGSLLYEDVEVYGNATFVRETGRIHSFTIERVQAIKKGTLTEALQAVYDAGGSDWDKIDDPEAFIRDLRGV